MRATLPSFLVARVFIARVVVATVVIVTVLSLAACERAPTAPAAAPPAAPPPTGEVRIPDEVVFLAQIDKKRGEKDCFTPLRDPEFVRPGLAKWMDDAELVLACDLGEDAVCYPTRYLNFHEIVEHRMAGLDLLACWCPLCRTGAVHVRTIDGKPARFGHSGWLWFNAYLLYDEETESLWHHLWGTALSGPRRGTRLRTLPVRTMTWAAWRAERPETWVLAKPEPTPEKQTGEDVYASRNRLIHLGFGLAAGGVARLYPLADLPPGTVVEEEVAGVAVALVRDVQAETVFAWDRRVGGRTISLVLSPAEPGAPGEPRPPILRERDGSRAWRLGSGDPVPGTGAEAPLRALPGSMWEDAAWRMQHRGGTVWAPAAPGGSR